MGNTRAKIISLIVVLLTLPFLIGAVQKAQIYWSSATGNAAEIVIDTNSNLGPLPRPWSALAQGGEEKKDMLTPTIPAILDLAPKYIRIDHIYDFYDVVTKDSQGNLYFNFTKLDRVVGEILACGAKPLLSLSYMPPAISSGDITDPPANWNDWQETVKKTIEHYSGRGNKNLSDVYYEVWNEPDLFGKWKVWGDKDYRLLYLYAARGASSAGNVNPFKIGGPATTAFYRSWLDEFVKYVYQNNLRLDFFSWHKYSLTPDNFLEDLNYINSLLVRHGGSYLLPKFITEWGSDPENSAIHDTAFDAAHQVAVIRQILDRVDLAFTFEIKDGPNPKGSGLWGRWGILSHDLIKKPRYFSLLLLNKMAGDRLKVSGEGTWVSGFASREDQTIRVILSNYDKNQVHSENTPVSFLNLPAGEYLLRQTDLAGKAQETKEVIQEKLTKKFFLSPNSVILLELFPIK